MTSLKRVSLSITGIVLWILILLTYQPGYAHAADIPAFPEAQGFGSSAWQSCDRSNLKVIPVTTTQDRAPGDLRSCLAASGPRMCVFKVGGTIELNGRVNIENPCLYIAGQYAPGGGIGLRGTTLRQGQHGQMVRILPGAEDVIIRYMRARSGNIGSSGGGQINFFLLGSDQYDRFDPDINRVILDHVSSSWTLDENISLHRNIWLTGNEPDPNTWAIEGNIRNVTIQHSILSHGLEPHSTGLQMGGERMIDPSTPGKQLINGGMGVSDVSVVRNIFAHNIGRNPGMGINNARIVNNVMYNWGSDCCETHDRMIVDWIGNYFKPGPNSGTDPLIVQDMFFKGFLQHQFDDPSIYHSENVLWPDILRPLDLQTRYRIHYDGARISSRVLRTTAQADLSSMNQPFVQESATDPVTAFNAALSENGSSARLDCEGNWVTNRDPYDQSIIDDIISRTGQHISSPTSAMISSAYPPSSTWSCADADADHLPDAWEQRYSLSTNHANTTEDPDNDGYVNIEEYVNGTDPTAHIPAPSPTISPTGAPPKTGDINGDGTVSIADLSVLLSHFGSTNASLTEGDIDNDSDVDIADLALLLANFGS